MAYAGQVLDNPVSGERIIFRKTAAMTGGELLEIELILSPDGHVPGAHVHPIVEERFEVVEGALKVQKGLRTLTARPGDKVVVAPGTVHRFENAGDRPAHVVVQVRPALQMEELFETSVALAQEGRTTSTGMPHPLDLALFMRRFEAEVGPPFVPAVAVRAVMAPLAWVGRRQGLDHRYDKPAVGAPTSRTDSRRPQSRRRYGEGLPTK